MPAKNTKKNAAANQAEQQARSDEEEARKLLDAATGAEGKSSPTYHGANKDEDDKDSSKADARRERAEKLRDGASGATGKSSPTYHQKGGRKSDNNDNDSDQGGEFESRGAQHTAWMQAVDKFVADADDVSTLKREDLHDAVKDAVGEEVLVTSASAIDEHFEQLCARRRSGLGAEAEGENQNQSGSKNASQSSNSNKKGVNTKKENDDNDNDQKQNLNKNGRTEAEANRADRLRDGASGATNKSDPTYHKDRKNWHDAVDKYMDSNETGATLENMRSAVRDAIGGDELIANAAAIEEYFQVQSTRRRDGIDAEIEDEGAQKRDRSGDSQQSEALASAPKAARTA